MSVYVALLRGINVGRNVRIAMPDVRAMLAELDCFRPRTLLQAGNLVFGHATRSSDELERVLETQIERRFGHRIDCFVRTGPQWESVVGNNPFVREAECDPAHVVAMLLKDTPAAEHLAGLRAALDGPELIATSDRTAYVVYPADMRIRG